MGKTTESLGDLLTGFAADLDDATLLAQFADPLAGPAAILGNATTRFLYDLGAYQRTSAAGAALAAGRLHAGPRDPRLRPGGAAALPRRPADHEVPVPLRLLRRLRPGDPAQGAGRARPGHRRRPAVSPRWAGSGWTIFDNKGRPVRHYEPFFSATNGFEFAAQTGVSTVAVLRPAGPRRGHAASRQQLGEDGLRPLARAAAGTATTPCWSPTRAPTPTSATTSSGCSAPRPFTSWYELRIGGTYGATAAGPGRAAGRGAARRPPHAATPGGHAPRLARPGLPGGRRQRRRGPLSGPHRLRHRGPAAGRLRRAGQAGGGVRATAARSRAAGPVPGRHATWPASPLYHVNADGGARRGLTNVAGQPIRSWDARGHAFRLVYDPAQRPTQRYVSTGRRRRRSCIDLSVYGEGQPAANLCGRLFRALRHGRLPGEQPVRLQGQPGGQRPAARRGLPPGRRLDAAGQPDHRRRSSTPPRPPPGWCRPATAAGTGSPAARVYDALNRPVQLVTPHNPAMQPDVIAARLRRGGPAQPGRRLAAAGRRARRAARPGHGRPARGHRHRLQRPRPAGLDLLRQRHRLGLRLRPADLPADAAHHHPARRRSPPASRPCRTWPTTTTRSATSPGSATTPTPRT